MYYSHFGLTGPPFQLTSSPAQLFMSKEHREAYAALEWGLLHEPSGFTVLIGEVGTGKTTLTLAILAREYDHVGAVYLSNPKLSFEEMLKLIMQQLRIERRGDGKLADLEAVNEFLCGLQPRALRSLIRHSSGIPRRINVLCHNAMLLAYAGGARVVDKRMVEAAVTEYDSLFSTLRSRPAGVRDARVRRWLGRALEAVALK